MTFDEVQFPVAISMGSRGGPQRQTQIVVMGSGSEARNARWVNSRRSYNVAYGLHSMNDLYAVLGFWEARNGRLRGFRFKDWGDFRSRGPDDPVLPTDQEIGVGAVTPTTFQLIKTYTSGPVSWTRTITKPVQDSVRIAFNGVEQPGSAFTVDYTTGLVTFSPAPGAGVLVTAGFEFDVPVRFDTDKLELDLEQCKAGKFPSIPIMELPLVA